MSSHLQTRPLQAADLDAVLSLLNEYSHNLLGIPATTKTFLQNQWQSPEFQKAIAWVVETGGKDLVGYMTMLPSGDASQFTVWGRTHPAYTGQGIGSSLLETAERASASIESEQGAEKYIYARINQQDQKAVQLLTERDYTLVRQFWQMSIDLDTPVSNPPLPEGISIRALNVDDLPALHHTYNTVLLDHWGFTPIPYDQWTHMLTTPAECYDPSLWFLAVNQQNEIVGYIICNPQQTHIPDMGYDPQAGWIYDMGVIGTWRRHGIARSLIFYSFNEFLKRGIHTVRLGVDTENPTGASHLYQQIGMQARLTFNSYRKRI